MSRNPLLLLFLLAGAVTLLRQRQPARNPFADYVDGLPGDEIAPAAVAFRVGFTVCLMCGNVAAAVVPAEEAEALMECIACGEMAVEWDDDAI